MNATTVTTARIRCAHCKAYHATIAEVRDCADWDLYVTSGQAEADSRAEIAAEARAERYWEEGPHGGYYAGSREEAEDRFYDSLIGL